MKMKSLLLACTALCFIGSARAADGNPPPILKATPAASAAYTWTGFYIGPNMGYGVQGLDTNEHGNLSIGRASTGLGVDGLNAPATGFFAGAQAGYNYQINSFVIGLDGTIDWSGVKGTANNGSSIGPLTVSGMASSKLDWLMTFDARFGYTITPNLLLYGKGGLAGGEVETSAATGVNAASACVLGCGSMAMNSTKWGWNAGAGMEYAVTRQWSAGVSWLHYALGNASGSFTTVGGPPVVMNFSRDVSGEQFLVTANYHPYQ